MNDPIPHPKISAVVLAAGLSTRMGRPKMILPWGSETVIGRVVSVLAKAGVAEIIVVTGGTHSEVEAALWGHPVRFAHNSHFANGEMLLSIQAGVEQLDPASHGFLLALGDQPQIESDVVKRVISAYTQKQAPLVVPSIQMRRGHPWLVDRALWVEILALQPPLTMRNFLHHHRDEIFYVEVDSRSILMDLDTPEDYNRQAPPASS
jgi:molybdenum cofactor cytidylyltransferase